ncbi:hypothetical protein C791_6321 [Amycolatopsis azurea DSM 43854]|uniref:Uncharacterized protein n=1 Tax=Amycolatopsis azurea DSM 43854 TaxID=1238180 RepID=M2PIG8_9PSEU|nr:hypothetical protein C791_6321 [Amycolatopsis azurea DSM 43854]
MCAVRRYLRLSRRGRALLPDLGAASRLPGETPPSPFPRRPVSPARGDERQCHGESGQPVATGRAGQYGRCEQCRPGEFPVARVSRTVPQNTQIMSECGDRTSGAVQRSLGSAHALLLPWTR